MMYLNLIALSCLSGFAAAQIWTAPGGDGWGWGPGWVGPDCASSCISSAFAPEPTAWSSQCSTGTALSSCVASACPTSAPTAPVWSFQSSVCSSWSSYCTKKDNSCTKWPGGWGDWGKSGHWGGPWGSPGGKGWYTVTASQTGMSTRTVEVTTTVSGNSVETSTITQTATLVTANAAATADNTAATPTATGAAGRVETANSVVALVAAALGVMAAA